MCCPACKTRCVYGSEELRTTIELCFKPFRTFRRLHGNNTATPPQLDPWAPLASPGTSRIHTQPSHLVTIHDVTTPSQRSSSSSSSLSAPSSGASSATQSTPGSTSNLSGKHSIKLSQRCTDGWRKVYFASLLKGEGGTYKQHASSVHDR